MRKTTSGLVLALILALGLPAGALAETQALPTSVDVMTAKWRKMNPSTYEGTHQSVLEQFDRVAAIDAALTSEKRKLLETMLKEKQGVEVWMPDGIGLDYLTGRSNGQPFVYRDMEKRLERADRALLYDLGDGVYVYWFTGTKGVSCNNIGVVIVPPPSQSEPEDPVDVPATVQTYRYVMIVEKDLEVFRMQGFIPSTYIRACCNNAGGYCSGLFIPGQMFGNDLVDEDPSYVRVRVPVPQTQD